jgi:hypothetical protein
MKEAAVWLRNMICFLCFFQVFLHLVPKEEYRKYLKFFGNLLLTFLILQPVLSALGKGEKLEGILRTEGLKSAYSELEMHMEGIEELKAEVVNRAFQEEIKRQIRGIPEAYGFSVLKLDLSFTEDNQPDRLGMHLLKDTEETWEQIPKIRTEIEEIYGIKEENMEILMQG